MSELLQNSGRLCSCLHLLMLQKKPTGSRSTASVRAGVRWCVLSSQYGALCPCHRWASAAHPAMQLHTGMRELPRVARTHSYTTSDASQSQPISKPPRSWPSTMPGILHEHNRLLGINLGIFNHTSGYKYALKFCRALQLSLNGHREMIYSSANITVCLFLSKEH